MAGNDHEDPRAQIELRESLGIRLFTEPPEEFDPLVGTDDDLMRFGYPPRPDALVHPELHELWAQRMSRPMTLITPEFGGPPEGWVPPPAEVVEPTVSTGWAGAVTAIAHGDTDAFTLVSGVWTVPHVVLPPGETLAGCACWVGMDDGQPPNPILQAGTTQVARYASISAYSPRETQNTWAWFQMYLVESPITLTNLRVAPGDSIFCLIEVESSTAFVRMFNFTTRVGIAFQKQLPTSGDVQFHGYTAEWILENPVVSGHWLGPLPGFAEIWFSSCLAATRNGEVRFADTSRLENMVTGSAVDDRIAVPQAVSRGVIRIRYTAHWY